VPALDLGGVRAGGQPLGDKHADDLEHPRAGPVRAAVELDQAVAGQLLGQFQRPVLIQAGHLGRGLGGPAIGEHRRDLQQRPLGVTEQPHAPLHRGP